MHTTWKALIVAGTALAVLSAGAVAAAHARSDDTRAAAPSTVHPPLVNSEGRVSVGSRTGTRGTVEAGALEGLKDRAGQFLGLVNAALVAGESTAADHSEVDLDVVELSQAVMDIEAIPVLDDDGEQEGWLGANFFELDEHAERVSAAHAVVVESTGRAYDDW